MPDGQKKVHIPSPPQNGIDSGTTTVHTAASRLVCLLMGTVLFALCGAAPAHADKGSGHGGGGSSGESGSGSSDSHSGGSGSHGSGHSDDDGGSGRSDDEHRQESRGDRRDDGSKGADRQRTYDAGWRVEIRNGRYRIFDPEGRLVINRRARQSDYGKF